MLKKNKATHEQLVEWGRQGGKMSGEARRQTRTAREFAKAVFSADVRDEATGETISAKELLVRRLIAKAIREEDLPAAKYLFDLIGESPAQAAKEEVKEAVMQVYGDDYQKYVASKKRYIVKLLKKEGKYSSELSYQITLTAQLIVKTEALGAMVLAPEHQSVNVEISREGNERRTINVADQLYLTFVEKTQRALRALGMNYDSKERKGDGPDGFADFLNAMKND